MSEAVAAAGDVDTTALQHLELNLKGKSEPFPAWIEKAADVKEDK
ncbi:MAG: hypothetical protein ACC658_05515 [Acidimicrobiia bacterium]